MKKYMIFGWSPDADKRGPADEFLGTSSEIISEVEATAFVEGEGQRFGRKHVVCDVPLADYLLNGNTHEMIKVIHYSFYGGLEAGYPILAYMEIKDRDRG